MPDYRKVDKIFAFNRIFNTFNRYNIVFQNMF